MKHLKSYNESIRDKMTPKSKEEIDVIRKGYEESYDFRKREVNRIMNSFEEELDVELKTTENDEGLEISMVYNNITYYIIIKLFEYESQVGFYNDKKIGNWEDIEDIDDGGDHLIRWIDENEWNRKNNIELGIK